MLSHSASSILHRWWLCQGGVRECAVSNERRAGLLVARGGARLSAHSCVSIACMDVRVK